MMPEALVPTDCDLRGMEWMPLYGGRLFGSDFDAHASDAEFRAGMQLWWAAWNQVPAASLPADDVALCRLAGLGRDLKTWRKIKARALHGFIECADGRLYHRQLAAFASESWKRRLADRDKKKRWRERREQRDKDRDGTVPETGTEPAVDRSGTVDETRCDETRRDSNSEAKASGAKAPARDVIFAECLPWLERRSGKNCRSLVGKWLSDTRDDDAIRQLLEDCERENPIDPVGWVSKRLQPSETWNQRRIREATEAAERFAQ